MSHQNQFSIRNDFSQPLTVNVEPEGVFYCLDRGEEVSVKEAFTVEPLSIKIASSDKGDPVISIWPGDGDVRVEKNGADVLDLAQTTDVWISSYQQINKAPLFRRLRPPTSGVEPVDSILPKVERVRGDDVHPVFMVTVAVPKGVQPDEIGAAFGPCDDALAREFPGCSIRD
ncbi:MAG TPA: hypothetical protein VFI31_27740 [Pirellulales bacterium]|nr:hypothetical protein [Pirellulales bacterium]